MLEVTYTDVFQQTWTELLDLTPPGTADSLRASGHRLEVCLVGVESFAARQLERFKAALGDLPGARSSRSPARVTRLPIRAMRGT